MSNTQARIKSLIGQGVYHQDKLFATLYPTYKGHYSRLRDLIAKEKNNA